jgi:2-dehydro-3-deoxygalactonokinase
MDWAAVEWASGELRLWQGDRTVTTPCRDDPAAILRDLVLPSLVPGQVVSVVASGWPGVEPQRVPCPPPTPGPALTIDPQIRLHPLPGLVQDRPADLIDNAVPRITGHLATDPNFDGVLCLPGRPSAWVQISAGEVVSFRSFLTVEILSALCDPAAGIDGAGFPEAVAQAMSRPAALAAELASVRAELALARIGPATAQIRMAGLLIGAELAAARPWWLGQNVTVVGTGWLADCYAGALAAQGVTAARADPDHAWLAGMQAAQQAL